MSRVKLLIFFIAIVSIAVVLLRLFPFSGEAEDEVSPQPVAVEETSTGLGIIYLPVTQGLSEYYRLGVDYGALVTEIIPGSPADRSGIQVGDVIITFDDATLEPKAQLLGMMMACPAGHIAKLEVRRGTETKLIKITHRTIKE